MLKNFKRATEKDIVRLKDSYSDSFCIFDTGEKDSLLYIKELFVNGIVYHISVDDEVIGWLAYEVHRNVSVLKGIYVKSAYHGTKLSRDLMKFYFEVCASEGVKYSLLNSSSESVWTTKFYKKYGYESFHGHDSDMIYHWTIKNDKFSTLIKSF